MLSEDKLGPVKRPRRKKPCLKRKAVDGQPAEEPLNRLESSVNETRQIQLQEYDGAESSEQGVDSDQSHQQDVSNEAAGREPEPGNVDESEVARDATTPPGMSAKRAKRNTTATPLEAANKTGVIYLSRIPPHLKPQKLRHILSQYGELGRLYLAPEDPSVRKKRKRMKGNTGKNFSEGWVEFLDKKIAKRVALTLNGNPMGGKHRSAFQYDIWCLKYLSKFKWDYLTEELAYQRAVREQKMAAEISAAKKERDFYLTRVDRAKAQEARQARQQKRSERPVESAEAGEAVGPAFAPKTVDNKPRLVRSYNQRQAKADPTEGGALLAPDVLSLLAGRK